MKLPALCILMIAVPLISACDKPATPKREPEITVEIIEPHADIYGKWRAEHFTVGGIGLPIGPMLEFGRERFMVDGKTLKVASYEKKDKAYTVYIADGPSLAFELVDRDTLTINLPLVGSVRYRRAP